jgi:hypothetical protein
MSAKLYYSQGGGYLPVGVQAHSSLKLDITPTPYKTIFKHNKYNSSGGSPSDARHFALHDDANII